MEHNSANYTLAIDPGTHTTGVAVFEGCKVVESATLKAPYKVKDGDLRAFNLIEMLEEMVLPTLTCHSCGITHATLVYENPQMFRIKGGMKTIEPVVRMSGMLNFWGLQKQFRVYRYNVSTIKTGVAGRNAASKEEVERIMHRVLDMEDHNRTDHEYDAMSVAVYHLDKANPGCFGAALPM
jgi:Holliday junction resolvasome RuvABC endonuclease subunit